MWTKVYEKRVGRTKIENFIDTAWETEFTERDGYEYVFEAIFDPLDDTYTLRVWERQLDNDPE